MKIKIDNVSKTYGKQKVLHNVSFEVEEGTLLSILGESGAGKTTILQIISGLIAPDSGRVYIDNVDVTTLPAEKREIGYVFQMPLLFPHMTVEENICFGLEVKKWQKRRMAKRTKELLRILQIEGLEARMPSEISGGQQQRVAIARALAPEPRVLLMDEPFSSLDPGLRNEMGELIKKIQTAFGVSIIFVTHDRNESMALSHSIALLMEGRIAQVDTPQNIYYRPNSKRTALYMGECNFISGNIKDNIFRSSAGSFKAGTYSDGNVELLLRPHQIMLDLNSDGYVIEECKVAGKSVIYSVSNGKTRLLVENFSNEVLKSGHKIGLVFPTGNMHFIS